MRDQNHTSHRTQPQQTEGRPLTFALLLLVALAACATPRSNRDFTVSMEASRALADARRRLRLGEPGVAEAAERAQALAPDWVAPRRILDDLLAFDLLAPRALMAHRAQLTVDSYDAGAHYLAGRLEDAASVDHFWRAVNLDPGFSWGYHALATRAMQADDWDSAIRFGEMASMRARDPNERGHFLASLARYLRGAKQHIDAVGLLMGALGYGDRSSIGEPKESDNDYLLEEDRLRLRIELARCELASHDRDLQERGFSRAVLLIRDEELDNSNLMILRGRAVLFAPSDRRFELQLALAAQESSLRRELELSLLDAGDSALAYSLAKELSEQDPAWRGLRGEARVRGFRHGDPSELIETWLSLQPSVVLDLDGLPKRSQLRELVLAGRSWPGRDASEGLNSSGLQSEQNIAAHDAALRIGMEGHTRLLDALIGAGWFREARAFASSLPGGSSQQALDAYRRASAHQAWIDGLTRLTKNMESGRSRYATSADLIAPLDEREDVQIETLEELLEALEGLREQLASSLGEVIGTDSERSEELTASPSIRYGSFGEVIHPGPHYSALDESQGLGKEGALVPGLAAQLDACGRFGIFGSFLGGGVPDGTVLQLLHTEERDGQHLGVPWRGTIAWCEGADLPGRAARQGASIGGAALHEGYYVDVEPLRAQLSIWTRLYRRFSGPGSADRVEQALAEAALRPELEYSDDARRNRDSYCETRVLLGVTDRVRLAVMKDLGAQLEVALGESAIQNITLDDLVELTAVHEEGHLCDRSRFYPIGRNWVAALGLVLKGLLRSEGVMGYLEYRAELIALCEVSEPRIVLAQILSARESGFSSVTPHGAAYVHLLDDFVVELDHACADQPDQFASIDRERLLVQQLHRLGGEQVREIGLRLAKSTGLDWR
ncbi:MAG: hypothetical protein ACI841_000528 [Planctomycetota bacterium]|jgi:hypothetical protein